MMIITKYAIYLSREDDNGEINAFTRFMICWVCRSYLSGLDCSVLSLDECLIKINYERFCVCFRCLEKVILWSLLCLAKDEFRYHRYHVYLIFLSRWMIYGGQFIWFDLLTSKIHQVEGKVLVSICIFFNKINTYRLKRW